MYILRTTIRQQHKVSPHLLLKNQQTLKKPVYNRPAFEVKLARRAEALFLMPPQVASYFIARCFELGSTTFSNGVYTLPYFFTVHDILADYWEEVEEQ